MAGGQTTVIRRILERPTPGASLEDTSASLAVMLRVVPPPRALLVCRDALLRQQLEHRIAAELDCEACADAHEALRRFDGDFRPVVITDCVDFVSRLRARPLLRTPFVLYLAHRDEPTEREAGLAAGADDCVSGSVSQRELAARLAGARRIAALEGMLQVALAENRKLSTTDDLTRVNTRRFFGKQFPREVERAARYGRALSLVLCDIDGFKNINDIHGRAGGDQILCELCARLQLALRRGVDWVARIGGEEFAIVLPETGYQQGLEVARKLRTALAESPFSAEGKQLEVTASFGLCGSDAVPTGEQRLADRVLKIADAALYRSKNSGRNRVTATMLNAASG